MKAEKIGFECPLSEGRKVAIVRYERTGAIGLWFSRPSVESDTALLEIPAGEKSTAAMFRQDGKTWTVVNMSDEAAIAAFCLINRLMSEEGNNELSASQPL